MTSAAAMTIRPALPRANRQKRRLIHPHDKRDNYLDIYRTVRGEFWKWFVTS